MNFHHLTMSCNPAQTPLPNFTTSTHWIHMKKLKNCKTVILNKSKMLLMSLLNDIKLMYVLCSNKWENIMLKNIIMFARLTYLEPNFAKQHNSKYTYEHLLLPNKNTVCRSHGLNSYNCIARNFKHGLFSICKCVLFCIYRS